MSKNGERVIKIIVEQLQCQEEQVKPEAKFIEDLGADSLDVVELTMALEESFSLPDTPENELMNIHTVGDLAAYVSKVTQQD